MTRDDLHLDDDVTAASVNRFDKNVYDLGNIYLNINRQGYLNMDAGQTYELNVLRNWQAIESFMNGQIALPDAHYRVLSLDGGDLKVEGEIDSLTYEDSGRDRGGLFSRLFR